MFYVAEILSDVNILLTFEKLFFSINKISCFAEENKLIRPFVYIYINQYYDSYNLYLAFTVSMSEFSVLSLQFSYEPKNYLI